MKIGHQLLESHAKPAKIILEIGPGSQPHWKWMKDLCFDKYIALDSQSQLEKIEASNFFNESKLVKLALENRDDLYEQYSNRIDRIILNHVFEHVEDPEGLLLWCTSLLTKNGEILIGLPCDPGLLWRLGQIVSMSSSIRKYGYQSKSEKDLMWSRQHINAIQRLLAIFRGYYSNPKILWFPSFLPSINLNLLCIIKLNRENFNSF